MIGCAVVARKSLKERSNDVCKRGCKGRIVGKGRYCSCLEKKLPKNGRKSVAVQYTDQIERFSGPIEAYQAFAELPQEQVIARLRNFGLREFEIELLVARFYENLTFGEIVKKYSWTSIGSASHAYKATLKTLRERGFKIRE